jgi:hypothetical protein
MFRMDSFWNGSICIGQSGIVHSIMFIMFSLKWFCNGMVHFVIYIMVNNRMVHFVMSIMVSNGMVHSKMFVMVNNGMVHHVMFTMFSLKWIYNDQ